MAHDFAKQRSSEKSAAPRRKHAVSATRLNESPGSHWPWFFTGLLTGLFLAFVGYLGLLRPPTPPAGAAMELAGSEEEDDGGPRFDFYDYLPEAEVQVDVIPVDVVREEPEFPAEAEDIRYQLQAGSFQARADADKRRADIILMNLDARVEPGTVAGKTMYRVKVGPFDNRQAAEVARDVLAENNVDSIPLRMR